MVWTYTDSHWPLAVEHVRGVRVHGESFTHSYPHHSQRTHTHIHTRSTYPTVPTHRQRMNSRARRIMTLAIWQKSWPQGVWVWVWVREGGVRRCGCEMVCVGGGVGNSAVCLTRPWWPSHIYTRALTNTCMRSEHARTHTHTHHIRTASSRWLIRSHAMR